MGGLCGQLSCTTHDQAMQPFSIASANKGAVSAVLGGLHVHSKCTLQSLQVA